MAGPTQSQLMEQLVQLTEAVKQLAERPTAVAPVPPVPQPHPDAVTSYPVTSDGPDPNGAVPAVVTEADRIRQRVAFAYRALGALTGRVSTATGQEFDVPVVTAERCPDRITFDGLPHGANWVELRSGGKVEVLRIQRGDVQLDDDHDSGHDQPRPAKKQARHHHRPGRGLVHPSRFADTEPIGSIVFLRTARGPLVAFGPRLAPVSTYDTDLKHD